MWLISRNLFLILLVAGVITGCDSELRAKEIAAKGENYVNSATVRCRNGDYVRLNDQIRRAFFKCISENYKSKTLCTNTFDEMYLCDLQVGFFGVNHSRIFYSRSGRAVRYEIPAGILSVDPLYVEAWVRDEEVKRFLDSLSNSTATNYGTYVGTWNQRR